MSELPKAYDPREVEAKWYDRWLAADAFVAKADSDKPPYVIVIPPPNVTGSLHMGHALTNTIQDILIRWRRMQGYEALWLPGTDHAGIATQTVVERDLRREGLDRRTLGREKFLERTWAWKARYGSRIEEQWRRMGCSVDWTRNRFTMDDGLSRAVREVFVQLWEQGLLYRDDRLVNWDPVSQTVLSDLEVEQEEEDGFLWHIAYPVVGSDERLVVATTRPETLLGDTAVAIHPDDPRYTHLHGKSVRLPICGREIPIICDPIAANMEFGSGAVKITPGHDFNDFETGKRNNLARITVLDREARLNENAPEHLRGLDRFEARKRVIEELRAAGLLVKEEAHRFMPGRSQRSGVIVEPMSVGHQWFMRMKPLADPAVQAVRDGRITFVPESWEKTYYHWMENIRDWCVSRQLWWGHRIPAWTCGACGELTVARHDPATCPKCGHAELSQEEDVLDTWFSSGLWAFSTLGWPEKTEDLKKFYPTSVMETGFDIIFFWVARMIMFGLHFMGDVPFRTVFLHAMVRDREGQKMSKTKGNVIDPLHLIDGVDPSRFDENERATYSMLLKEFPDGLTAQGADALRYTLATYAAAGRDIKLDVRRVEGYRGFMNKLWNATRFALMNLDGWTPTPFDASTLNLSPADRWILTRLRVCITETTAALEKFQFSDAAQRVYEFAWHEFCDWYLELIKPTMYQREAGIPGDRAAAQATVSHVLNVLMRLLHPFAPFISEELNAALPRAGASELVCRSAWPSPSEAPEFKDDEAAMAVAIELIVGIRRARQESELPATKPVPTALLVTDDEALRASIHRLRGYIEQIARVESVNAVDSTAPRPAQAATTVEAGIGIVIPMEGLIDVAAERARIEKELQKVEKDITFFTGRLSNERFVNSAPQALLDEARGKLAAAQEARTRLEAGLEKLGAS